MIEELTEKKLIEYGFSKDTIERVLKQGNSACAKLSNNLGNYYASPDEQKIYSGDDFFLKTESYMLFPYDNYKTMVPVYYELNLKVFLNAERKGSIGELDEQKAKAKFNKNEIDKTKISGSEFILKSKHKIIDNYYIEWLNSKVIAEPAIIEDEIINTLPANVSGKQDGPRVKMKVIALIHIYNRDQITDQNAVEIAAKYGYISPMSGEGLTQDYSHYTQTSNRVEKPTPCTEMKLRNKINLFKEAAETLTNAALIWANIEIKLLEKLLEAEYQ